jgi:hypothetical protein
MSQSPELPKFCYIFYVTPWGRRVEYSDRSVQRTMMFKPYDDYDKLMKIHEIKELAEKISKEKGYTVHKVDIAEKRGASLKTIRTFNLPRV